MTIAMGSSRSFFSLALSAAVWALKGQGLGELEILLLCARDLGIV